MEAFPRGCEVKRQCEARILSLSHSSAMPLCYSVPSQYQTMIQNVTIQTYKVTIQPSSSPEFYDSVTRYFPTCRHRKKSISIPFFFPKKSPFREVYIHALSRFAKYSTSGNYITIHRLARSPFGCFQAWKTGQAEAYGLSSVVQHQACPLSQKNPELQRRFRPCSIRREAGLPVS